MLYRLRRNWIFPVLAVILFLSLMMLVWKGAVFITLLVALLSSPILLAGVATWVESRRLRDVADPRVGSWSFLIGDTFVLAPALALCAHAWRDIPERGWIVSWWWVLLCLLTGLAAGLLFHWWDSGNYKKVRAGNRLSSPSKLGHDLIAYPVLFGGMLCAGVPLLANWSWHTWVVLALVAVWFVLVGCDAKRQPSPFDMHPAWNDRECRPLAPDDMR